MTVREAARSRRPLDGADAQGLEHALTQAEREIDAIAEALGLVDYPEGQAPQYGSAEQIIARIKERMGHPPDCQQAIDCAADAQWNAAVAKCINVLQVEAARRGEVLDGDVEKALRALYAEPLSSEEAVADALRCEECNAEGGPTGVLLSQFLTDSRWRCYDQSACLRRRLLPKASAKRTADERFDALGGKTVKERVAEIRAEQLLASRPRAEPDIVEACSVDPAVAETVQAIIDRGRKERPAKGKPCGCEGGPLAHTYDCGRVHKEGKLVAAYPLRSAARHLLHELEVQTSNIDPSIQDAMNDLARLAWPPGSVDEPPMAEPKDEDFAPVPLEERADPAVDSAVKYLRWQADLSRQNSREAHLSDKCAEWLEAVVAAWSRHRIADASPDPRELAHRLREKAAMCKREASAHLQSRELRKDRSDRWYGEEHAYNDAAVMVEEWLRTPRTP